MNTEEKEMMKTRILERTFGSQSTFTPQVFKEKRLGFLFYWCWHAWEDIGDLVFTSRSAAERDTCLRVSKQVIDSYMIQQGNYAQLTHEYPKVQK